MHYIITGATGFVGKQLVLELLKQKEEVTVLVRDAAKIPKEWSDNVQVIKTDLHHFKEVKEEQIAGTSDRCFIHMAWEGTAGQLRADEQIQLSNIIGVHDAVELAARLKCKRFVYAGSIMEYEAMKALVHDGFEPGLGMIYSTAKLAADFMGRIWCKNYGLDYVCVIISNIFGPGEKSERFLNTLIRRMLHNESIDLTHGNQLYDFIYITDAVHGIYMVADKGEAYNSYYLGNPQARPLKEFIVRAKEVLQSACDLNFGAVPYSGVPLTWEEFDDAVRPINIKTFNLLVVSMAMCYGGALLSHVNPDKRAPYLCFIGSYRELSEGEIVEGYHRFYESYSSPLDISAAYKALVSIYGEDKNPYGLFTQEFIFDETFNPDRDPANFKKMIEML